LGFWESERVRVKRAMLVAERMMRGADSGRMCAWPLTWSTRAVAAARMLLLVCGSVLVNRRAYFSPVHGQA